MHVTHQTQCILLKVEQNKNKLWKLHQVIDKHFRQKRRILITVQDASAATYLDQWLWQIDESMSFLPHKIASELCSWPIVITLQKNNWNNAPVLINLCAAEATNFAQFKVIYELSDVTNKEKYEITQQKLHYYRAGGCKVWEE